MKLNNLISLVELIWFVEGWAALAAALLVGLFALLVGYGPPSGQWLRRKRRQTTTPTNQRRENEQTKSMKASNGMEIDEINWNGIELRNWLLFVNGAPRRFTPRQANAAQRKQANQLLVLLLLAAERALLPFVYWLWPLAATNANQINFVDLWGLHSLLILQLTSFITFIPLIKGLTLPPRLLRKEKTSPRQLLSSSSCGAQPTREEEEQSAKRKYWK